jgi:hypothetical protein
MRRVGIITALSAALLVLSASVALATIVTAINPANAPNGTHYKSGQASCSVGVDGLTVSCTGYTLAGVGNADASGLLSVVYSATVACRNSGGQLSDSQHQGSFSKSAGPTNFAPKNGNLTVTSFTVSPPSPASFLGQQTCPNPNWTPELASGITLTSFTYTLTFTGFTGAYITITGP